MYNYHNNTIGNNFSISQQLYTDSTKRQLKKDCSSMGINIVFVFLLMDIFSAPLVLFLRTAEEGQGNIQGFDPISYYLFNSFLSFSVFFVFQLIFAKIKKLDLNQVLPFKYVPLKKLFPLLAVGYAVFSLANYATSIISSNLQMFGIEDTSASADMMFGNTVPELLLCIVAIGIVPAITEEFAFRGIILGGLQKYGDGFAVVVSSILFGLMHGNLSQIPFAFIGGLILGYMRVYSKSMFPSMIMHCINNTIAVSLNLLSGVISENIINIAYLIFIIAIAVCAIISIVYLVKNDKDILNFSKDKVTNLQFSEKIKIFFGNAGVIWAIILALGIVAISTNINV